MIKKLRTKAKLLKRETYTLYLVYKDARVSWWRRLVLGVVIGYAFCPIDLIPDFIPILGYLDDIILVPIGISLALRLIPQEIIQEYRKKVIEENEKEIPLGKKTAVLIIVIWIVGLSMFLIWLFEIISVLLSSNYFESY